MVRWHSVVLLMFVGACSSDSGPRLRDGGAFVLPDAGFADATVYDTGVDAGPFECAPVCSGGAVCGCLETSGDLNCGCHAPGNNLDACDPQNPATCAAPTVCSRTRQAGRDFYVCTDGRQDNPCSKSLDTCTTALGCVCLTPPSGQTDCRCVERFDQSSGLCDRMVPETCDPGTCVRATGVGGGAYFFCSDGSVGSPCERGDGSCTTSLGCTCPVLGGREVCICSEPGVGGQPCDRSVSGSCESPLMCITQSIPEQGVTTTCGSGTPDGGMLPGCDPLNLGTCPPGTRCEEVQGALQCVPN